MLELIEASGQAARNLLRILASRVRYDNVALSESLAALVEAADRALYRGKERRTEPGQPIIHS